MKPRRSTGRQPEELGTTTADSEAERRLKRLAWLLDSSIPLPGGYRIGLDGLIGLVPGLGDAAGALLASYVVVQAGRLGAPRSLLVRMGFNVLVETVVGAVPVIGDLFDFAFKANLRNVRLLERHVRQPAHSRASSRMAAGAIVLGMLAALAVAAVSALAIVNLIWQALSAAGQAL